eukprot:Rhum_TRINITY_DN25098_c0_g1::Rhum_TRINITY_DN25098_c0_g1_i1::g.180814::m.180814
MPPVVLRHGVLLKDSAEERECRHVPVQHAARCVVVVNHQFPQVRQKEPLWRRILRVPEPARQLHPRQRRRHAAPLRDRRQRPHDARHVARRASELLVERARVHARHVHQLPQQRGRRALLQPQRRHAGCGGLDGLALVQQLVEQRHVVRDGVGRQAHGHAARDAGQVAGEAFPRVGVDGAARRLREEDGQLHEAACRVLVETADVGAHVGDDRQRLPRRVLVLLREDAALHHFNEVEDEQRASRDVLQHAHPSGVPRHRRQHRRVHARVEAPVLAQHQHGGQENVQHGGELPERVDAVQNLRQRHHEAAHVGGVQDKVQSCAVLDEKCVEEKDDLGVAECARSAHHAVDVPNRQFVCRWIVCSEHPQDRRRVRLRRVLLVVQQHAQQHHGAPAQVRRRRRHRRGLRVHHARACAVRRVRDAGGRAPRRHRRRHHRRPSSSRRRRRCRGCSRRRRRRRSRRRGRRRVPRRCVPRPQQREAVVQQPRDALPLSAAAVLHREVCLVHVGKQRAQKLLARGVVGEVVHERRLRRRPLRLPPCLRCVPVLFLLVLLREAGHPQQVRRRRVQVRRRARREHREGQTVRVDAAAVHVQYRVPQHERHHRVRHEVPGVDAGGGCGGLGLGLLVAASGQRCDARQALRAPARGAVQRAHDALQHDEQVAQLRVLHLLGPVRAVAGHQAAEGAAEGAAAAGGRAVQHDGFGGGVEGGAEVGAQVRVAVEGGKPAQAFVPRDRIVRHAVILQFHQEVIPQPFGGRLLAHVTGSPLATSKERRMTECTTEGAASSMPACVYKSHAALRASNEVQIL